MRPPHAASIITAVALVAAAAVARRRLLQWGATDAEVGRSLTGDELVSDADLISTRAITIRAGVDDVWPWIVQLGQGRGGFYSYDRLENLAGCDIRSAEARSTPSGNTSRIGDAVQSAPEVALTVAAVKPPPHPRATGRVPARSRHRAVRVHLDVRPVARRGIPDQARGSGNGTRTRAGGHASSWNP